MPDAVEDPDEEPRLRDQERIPSRPCNMRDSCNVIGNQIGTTCMYKGTQYMELVLRSTEGDVHPSITKQGRTKLLSPICSWRLSTPQTSLLYSTFITVISHGKHWGLLHLVKGTYSFLYHLHFYDVLQPSEKHLPHINYKSNLLKKEKNHGNDVGIPEPLDAWSPDSKSL